MKKILIPLFALIVGCGQTEQNTVNVEVSNNTPGFNVTNFAQLLKTTKDPQSLEQSINSTNNNINNLDLNNDSQVDYLKVVEQQNGTIQVVDEYSNTQSTVVATLTVNQQAQTMNVSGNQAYCGDNYMYQSHFSAGDYLLMAYLFRPHPYYVPVYHYGYYPSYYHRSAVVRRTYTTSNRTSINRSNIITNSRSSISTPSSSQRSFQSRSSSSPVRSGGFGSSRSSSSSSSSRSGFGSSRSSSFGRRR